MLSIRLLANFILAAIGFWLMDALILSLTDQLAYLEAFFSGASQGRLYFRLIIVFAILIPGFLIALRKEAAMKKVMRMPASDRASLFGYANSKDKSKRLLYYALRISALMKMNKYAQNDLRKLCYCYDIGLIGVPTDIQNRAANLDEDEQKIWNSHIELGAKIANNIPQLVRISKLIACHEEFYDGSGHKLLSGKNIPLACRIFTVVLMFDYFTHPHSDSVIMDNEQALDEMDLYIGSWLDPEVMEAFHNLFSNEGLASSLAVKLYWQS